MTHPRILAIDPGRLGWLAGFFDGEGSVNITRYRASRSSINFAYRPKIEVCNTHQPTIDYAYELVVELGCSGATYQEYRPLDLNKKPYFTVHISKMSEIVALGEQLLPFAVTKKEQWQLLTEFCKSRQMYIPDQIGVAGVTSFTSREIALFNRCKVLVKKAY